MKRNILLCVAGLTPQIITESLYVLAVQHHVLFDEIRVITSSIGRKLVKERLFDSGVWQSFCADYPQQTAQIRFDLDCLEILEDADKNELPDIRTTKENELAANQICEIVRDLTNQAETTIYASVAGGRKTMGNYLGFAMSLFAHTHDSLSHVLVDEEFERFRKPPLNFYYEPPISRQVKDIEGNDALTKAGKPLMTDMAKTTLAEIPFVKLRRILPEDYGEQPTDFAIFVEKVQKELDLMETNHELIINLVESKVKIANLEFDLTPCEMMMCVIFAQQRKDKNKADIALQYDDIGFDSFDKAIRLITKSSGVEYGLERAETGTPFAFLENYLMRRNGKVCDIKRISSNQNEKKIKLNKSLIELVRDYNSKLEKEKIPERFMIKPKFKTKNIPHLWLSIQPSKIIFIERQDSIHFNQFGRIS